MCALPTLWTKKIENSKLALCTQSVEYSEIDTERPLLLIMPGRITTSPKAFDPLSLYSKAEQDAKRKADRKRIAGGLSIVETMLGGPELYHSDMQVYSLAWGDEAQCAIETIKLIGKPTLYVTEASQDFAKFLQKMNAPVTIVSMSYGSVFAQLVANCNIVNRSNIAHLAIGTLVQLSGLKATAFPGIYVAGKNDMAIQNHGININSLFTDTTKSIQLASLRDDVGILQVTVPQFAQYNVIGCASRELKMKETLDKKAHDPILYCLAGLPTNTDNADEAFHALCIRSILNAMVVRGDPFKVIDTTVPFERFLALSPSFPLDSPYAHDPRTAQLIQDILVSI